LRRVPPAPADAETVASDLRNGAGARSAGASSKPRPWALMPVNVCGTLPGYLGTRLPTRLGKSTRRSRRAIMAAQGGGGC